tara:strand:- start:523 stop:708 length:186 start_codon:yes stop_codon:yes gene_type:complete
MIGYVIIFVKEMKDMGKRLSDDFVNNRLIVFGMESEEKNQEIKNKIVDTFNKKLEEEEDGD